jgi:hypothetical protein
MFQPTNPFLQHAVNQRQILITEVNKAKTLSQDIVSTCDNAVMAINSGNIQNAIGSIQNIRNMAIQVAQSTQFFNNAINERLEMSSYVLNSIQHKISEVSGAIEKLRGNSTNYQMGCNQYGMQQPWQSQQQGQYDSSSAQQQ